MTHQIVQAFGPFGQFLGGVAALLTVMASLGYLRFTSRKVITATTECMNRIIKQSLEREAEKWHPAEYYTLDIEFEGGQHLHVPMFLGKPMLVSENVEMCVNDHSSEFTEMGLRCKGIGSIARHRHSSAIETIFVERGSVTCLETGRIYKSGDTWKIEPGEWHSAAFQNCYCRVIHKPCLPTAAAQPVNMKALA